MNSIKKTLIVCSGKGGVGKTTIAYNIALALSEKGFKVGILDADSDGPNLPQVSKAPKPEILVDIHDNVLIPIEHEGLKLMSVGFSIPDHAPVLWRGENKIRIMSQIMQYTRWGTLDYLIIDCPAGTGDALRAVLETKPDGAIVVTIPHAMANSDANRARSMLKEFETPYMGLVINMAVLEVTCPQCNHLFIHKKPHIAGFTEEEIIAKIPDSHNIMLTDRIPNRIEITDKILNIFGRNLFKKSKKRVIKRKLIQKAFIKLS